MTYIKLKEIQEAVDDIKKEQEGLNDTERLKDWEERFIFRSEQLEEVKKELKETKESSNKKDYEIKFLREKEKIRTLENLLGREDEDNQISLLKKQYEKEIKELENSKDVVTKNQLDYMNEKEKLSKKLEEKKLLVEELKEENKNLKE
ncbi:MAG: hypothetical protein MRERC_1c021 [Mycoplasmataceae bacterium RC_NB112A]|nr:MAG: hypothetical protein MRERC_10c006 [Mycoplasmataceae bacterium RC_NB112A]KLL02441.1 MAG: hypothetical protein MRERC_1c021 [Mycoplasmataceae bacterium RC_NB112A]